MGEEELTEREAQMTNAARVFFPVIQKLRSDGVPLDVVFAGFGGVATTIDRSNPRDTFVALMVAAYGLPMDPAERDKLRREIEAKVAEQPSPRQTS